MTTLADLAQWRLGHVPCPPALVYLRRYSPAQATRAWSECPEGSWMAWLLRIVGRPLACDWTARHIVALAFAAAGRALAATGIEDTISEHAAALQRDGEAALDAARAAATRAAAVATVATGDLAASTATATAAASAASATSATYAATYAADAAAVATVATGDLAASTAAAAFAIARASTLFTIAVAIRELHPTPPPEVFAALGLETP